MKHLVKKIDSTSVEVSVELDEAKIKKAKTAVLKRLQPEVSAPGFRKGKVPLNIVEKQADDNYLQAQVLDEALNEAYIDLLKDEVIEPVSQPKVDVTSFVPYSAITAKINVEVVPEIKLGDYKRLKVKKESPKVTAEDIDEVVTNLQKRLADKKPVTRAAKAGDETVIDFAGTDADGKEIAGAKGSKYPLPLGSDTFIPGFEDNIIGMKPAEKKTFDLTFPKDYSHAPLANKKVTFSVTVHEVNEVALPKLDDAFAAKVGPFKTVKELKQDIETQLTAQKEQESLSAYRDSMIGALVEKSSFDIPPSLLEEQANSLMTEFKQNLVYRGITIEEYLAQAGQTEDEFKEQEINSQAERRVRSGLVLSSVAKAEKLDVTPEEVEVRLQLMKGQHQADSTMQSELESPAARRDITSRLMTEKTLARLEELNS